VQKSGDKKLSDALYTNRPYGDNLLWTLSHLNCHSHNWAVFKSLKIFEWTHKWTALTTRIVILLFHGSIISWSYFMASRGCIRQKRSTTSCVYKKKKNTFSFQSKYQNFAILHWFKHQFWINIIISILIFVINKHLCYFFTACTFYPILIFLICHFIQL